VYNFDSASIGILIKYCYTNALSADEDIVERVALCREKYDRLVELIAGNERLAGLKILLDDFIKVKELNESKKASNNKDNNLLKYYNNYFEI
jgi:hypothetical protein